MASSIIGIGTGVRIKDIRSGQGEEFGGWVTRFDEGTGRHYVTKLNDNGSNRAGAACEVIPRALRFDDGTPAQDGEDYVITSITGLTTDTAKVITEAALTIQGFGERMAASEKAAKEEITRLHAKINAVVETLCAQIGDDTSATMIREACRMCVPITNKPMPKPKANPATPPAASGNAETPAGNQEVPEKPTAPARPAPAPRPSQRQPEAANA